MNETLEAERYPKKTSARQMATETAENIRSSVELMDQTDEGELLVKTMVRMIEEKRLKVRVYTKGRMHAKAYIFDYGKVFDKSGKPIERHEEGIAIVGSSNLTLSGVTHNTELNVVVQGNDNHAELVRWFEDLWKEAEQLEERQRLFYVALTRATDRVMITVPRTRARGDPLNRRTPGCGQPSPFIQRSGIISQRCG